MNKDFVPCSADEHIATFYRDSLSGRLFSFVLEKYIVCDICGLISPSFERTSLLYITPTNNASLQELVLQDHKQKLYKTCSCCKKDTWHVESEHLLQPPNYLIITVNRFNYINDIITKNKSLIPLDLDIILGPYKFSLQATIYHPENFIHCGRYTASVNCHGQIFYCNDDRIMECNTIDTCNSSTVYILSPRLFVDWPITSPFRLTNYTSW